MFHDSNISWLFLSSRYRDHMNSCRSALFQGSGTGVHGGSCSHYIVNQQNPFVFQRSKKPTPKSAAYVNGTLWGCQTRLGARRTNPASHPFLIGKSHPTGQCRRQQCGLIEAALAAAGGMKRHSGDAIKVNLGIFGLHTGKKKGGQIASHPDGLIVFEIAKSLANGSFVAHRRTGELKSGRFAGAGEAGIVVLDVAGHRVAATNTKRGFNLRRVGKTVPAEVRERLRRGGSASNAIARVKQIKHDVRVARKYAIHNTQYSTDHASASKPPFGNTDYGELKIGY